MVAMEDSLVMASSLNMVNNKVTVNSKATVNKAMAHNKATVVDTPNKGMDLLVVDMVVDMGVDTEGAISNHQRSPAAWERLEEQHWALVVV